VLGLPVEKTPTFLGFLQGESGLGPLIKEVLKLSTISQALLSLNLRVYRSNIHYRQLGEQASRFWSSSDVHPRVETGSCG